MPDPITADQLEALVANQREAQSANYRFDDSTSVYLSFPNWNHIIACLREHEARQAEAVPVERAVREEAK